jgi:hypothetical protein
MTREKTADLLKDKNIAPGSLRLLRRVLAPCSALQS